MCLQESSEWKEEKKEANRRWGASKKRKVLLTLVSSASPLRSRLHSYRLFVHDGGEKEEGGGEKKMFPHRVPLRNFIFIHHVPSALRSSLGSLAFVCGISEIYYEGSWFSSRPGMGLFVLWKKARKGNPAKPRRLLGWVNRDEAIWVKSSSSRDYMQFIAERLWQAGNSNNRVCSSTNTRVCTPLERLSSTQRQTFKRFSNHSSLTRRRGAAWMETN